MSKQHKQLFLTVLVVVIIVSMMNTNLYPRLFFNHGDCSYETETCDEGSGGTTGSNMAGIASANSSTIGTYIVLGAGYFLNSQSSALLFLNKIEMCDLEGLHYNDLRATLYNAIAQMELAVGAYTDLKQTADITPYRASMIEGDNAYFVWEGNLRIINLNVKSGYLNFFGQKTSNYIKPYDSEKLHKGRYNRNLDISRNERTKMSFVKNIFASSIYVLVVYEGPARWNKPSNFRLQFYTLDGKFVREVPISNQPDRKMWFDKDKHILYSLSSKDVFFVYPKRFLRKASKVFKEVS